MRSTHSPSLEWKAAASANGNTSAGAQARAGTLEACFGLAPTRRKTVVVPPSRTCGATPPGINVVDLFSGGGGFSEGTRQAGHHVVLAVDNDPVAVETHRKNHPSTTHARFELGPETEPRLLKLIDQCVPKGGPWHLHGSPPCQAFSSTRMCRVARDCTEGMRLVEWFLALVLRLRPTSWSMEEVTMPCLTDYLYELALSHPVYFDHVSLNFADFGVPQSRKRTISGTPTLIAPLRDEALRVSPRRHLTEVVTPPTGATQIRAGWGRRPDASATIKEADGTYSNPTVWCNCVVSIDRPAGTVTTSGHPVWLDERFRTVRGCANEELAAWQTFPSSYRWPDSCANTQRMIGNSIPPFFVTILLRPLGGNPTQNATHYPPPALYVDRAGAPSWYVRHGNRKRGRNT